MSKKLLLLSMLVVLNARAEKPLNLIIRITDTQHRWETMGYTYGMMSPSGLPLGIYLHAGPSGSARSMLYRGLLPFGEKTFQFEGESEFKVSAISMEASVVDPEPISQCYVTQYACGEINIEGNCYCDEKNVIVMNSQFPFQVDFRRLVGSTC